MPLFGDWVSGVVKSPYQGCMSVQMVPFQKRENAVESSEK